MPTLKVRTVAGRVFEIEVSESDTVKEVLEKVCTEKGYAARGAKMIVNGSALSESGLIPEDVLPTFVGVKKPYSVTTSNPSSPSNHVTPSRERPADVNLSDDTYDGPLDVAHRQGVVQLKNALVRISETEVMDLLYIHPTVTHMRNLVQRDASLLQPILYQVDSIAPDIIDLLSKQSEAFLRLLNEPVPVVYRDTIDRIEERERDEMYASPPIDVADLQPEDIEALIRIQELGPFPRDIVLKVYVEAGRNEHLCAQYLMDLASSEPLTLQGQTAVEVFREQVAISVQRGDTVSLMRSVIKLGELLVRAGDREAESHLHRAMQLAITLVSTNTEIEAAKNDHARAATLLSSHYQASSMISNQILIHESYSMLQLALKGIQSKNPVKIDMQSTDFITSERLLKIVKRESTDVVYVHVDNDGHLVVWHLQHEESNSDAIQVKRSVQLTSADAANLLEISTTLSCGLACTSHQKVWSILQKAYDTIFGPLGCLSWLPNKVCFISAIDLPFHALTPHGGTPLGRGRLVTQCPSLLFLEKCQDLAIGSQISSKHRPLRSCYCGNAPGNIAASKSILDEIPEEEELSIAHFGLNTSGTEQITSSKGRKVDLAVYGPGVSDQPSISLWGDDNNVWGCTAVIQIVDAAQANSSGGNSPTSVAFPRAPRDGASFVQSIHRRLTAGDSKVQAFASAVTVPTDAHLRKWVPWVVIGTRLHLGGRRCHIKSEKLRATDDYAYLEVCYFIFFSFY